VTSEKSYDNAQRLDLLIPRLGALETATAGDTGWTDTGSLTSGWGKGSGYFKYRKLLPGVVLIAAKALTVGTVADATQILSNANGLGSGYQPAAAQQLNATTNSLKTSPVNASFLEPAWLEFEPGGGVQVFGVQSSATFLNCFGLIYTDI
jgi:hypothetical protein